MTIQFTIKEENTLRHCLKECPESTLRQIVDALTEFCTSNPDLMDKPVTIDRTVSGDQIIFEIQTLEETALFKKICNEWEDLYGKSRNQIPIIVYALCFHNIRDKQLDRFCEYVKSNTHYKHN